MNTNIDELTEELEEVYHRRVALADFIGANPRSVQLIDEALSVFSAFGGTEAFVVTPGFLRDSEPTGQKYGYNIYLLSLAEPIAK
jgi:hypothetical protein